MWASTAEWHYVAGSGDFATLTRVGGPRTAPMRAGTPGVTVTSVVGRTVMISGCAAQGRLPADVRQQLLDAIYGGQPFRRVLRDLGLTSNQVWGLTKTDQEWLESALTATRRDDLQHGTKAAYVRGCVCKECRDHQRERMGRNATNARLI